MSYKELIKMANRLDNMGFSKDADFIDNLILKKIAKKEVALEDILDRLNKTIFAMPYGPYGDNLKKVEDYYPYMMMGDELEYLKDRFQSLKQAELVALKKFQRLYDEIIAFIDDQEDLQDIDKEKILTNAESFKDGQLSVSFHAIFMYPLKNGGSYGHVKTLGGSYFQLYMKKESYKDDIDTAYNNYMDKISKIPLDMEDLIKKEGLSSKEEFKEFIKYLNAGITVHSIKNYRLTRSSGSKSLIHPFLRASNLKFSDILNVGRRYIKYKIRSFNRPRKDSYGIVNNEIEEEVEELYWPPEKEDFENLPEYAINSFNRERYLKNILYKNIVNNLDGIYQKYTSKEIISAIKEEIESLINSNIDKELNKIKKLLIAYNLDSDDYFNTLSFNYKENIYHNLNSNYAHNNYFVKFFKRIVNFSNPSITYLILDLESKNNMFDVKKDVAIEYFYNKALKYLDEIDVFSGKELEIDISKIISKVDSEVANEIRSRGISEVFPNFKYGSIKYNLDKFVSKNKIIKSIKDYSEYMKLGINEDIEGDKSEIIKNYDPETIRGLIFASRISNEGFSGFRNFRKSLNKKNIFTPINDRLKSVKKEKPLGVIYELKEKREDFLDQIDIYVESLNNDKLSETDKNQINLKIKNLSEKIEQISEEIKIANLKAHVLYTPNMLKAYDYFLKYGRKVLEKIYFEEEAFMIGKREGLYDESEKIANKLGIDDITSLLAKDVNEGISLPSRILKMLDHNRKLVSLYIAVSDPEEFSSIERLHSFFIKMLNFSINFEKIYESELYSLSEFDGFNFENILSKIIGTKSEKIDKILDLMNLLHNNKRMKEQILNSNYLNKFNLDIFKKTIQLYDQVSLLSEDESLEGIFENILEKKETIRYNFGEETAEQILPDRFTKLLRQISTYKNLDEFIEGIGLGSTNFSDSNFTEIKKSLAILSSGISTINNINSVSKYFSVAKKKDKNLFKLNMKTEKFKFTVLKDLDPYHFQVGIDTDCCQRIGGAGEDAAIDSFINPYAGVLTLHIKYDDEWKLVAQSYFHYVPKRNSIILDNIESNNKYVKKAKKATGYSVPEMYHILAQFAKSQGIDEFLLGKEYTTSIDSDDFNSIRLKKDPRHFETKDIYTDFDHEDAYNLFDSNIELEKMPNIIQEDKESIADFRNSIIKLAVIMKNSEDHMLRKIAYAGAYLFKNNLKSEALKIIAIL